MRSERIGTVPYRWPIRILLGTLALVSIGLIAVTLLNYNTTSRLAEQGLQNNGMTLALEIASEARARGARDAGTLQTILERQHRREVAFLVVVDRDGTVVAHTNPHLVGSSLDDALFARTRDTGSPAGAFVSLGTGEEVYELIARPPRPCSPSVKSSRGTARCRPHWSWDARWRPRTRRC